MIPFPSLRWKIQVFHDETRQNMTIPWNDDNTFQFSAPPKMPRNLRKQTALTKLEPFGQAEIGSTQ